MVGVIAVIAVIANQILLNIIIYSIALFYRKHCVHNSSARKSETHSDRRVWETWNKAIANRVKRLRHIVDSCSRLFIGSCFGTHWDTLGLSRERRQTDDNMCPKEFGSVWQCLALHWLRWSIGEMSQSVDCLPELSLSVEERKSRCISEATYFGSFWHFWTLIDYGCVGTADTRRAVLGSVWQCCHTTERMTILWLIIINNYLIIQRVSHSGIHVSDSQRRLSETTISKSSECWAQKLD